MEAEDILQDVFYQLTLGFRDLEGIRNITAWLYRVAENRIIDNYRKKRPTDISYGEQTIEGKEGPISKILLTGLAPGGHRYGPRRERRRKYEDKYCSPHFGEKESETAPQS